MQADSNPRRVQKYIEKSAEIFSADSYRVDKTAALEKAMNRFPSLYLEGAAASGKTTAVKMLLGKHTDVTHQIFFMDQEDVCKTVLEKLRQLSEEHTAKYCLVFENITSAVPDELMYQLADFVRNMPGHCNAIFVSRAQPPKAFLDLIWKRQMEIVPQRELLLSLQEVREMTRQTNSSLPPEELYQITGGWAGCVDIMIRLAEKEHLQPGNAQEAVSRLRGRYEIDTYIQEEILNTLSEQEQKIMDLGTVCLWMNESVCSEVLELDEVHDLLEGLERKGFLTRRARNGGWKAAPLFAGSEDRNLLLKESRNFSFSADQSFPRGEIDRSISYIEALEQWCERHGFLKEALWYCKQLPEEKEYCACLLRHYEKIPFLGIRYTEILKYQDPSPKAAYLRGMCYRASGNFRKMSQEAAMIGSRNPEIYLNLMFANPEISLDEWLELAENVSNLPMQNECSGKQNKVSGKIRLFDILGFSHTYLCGIRDLSGLFACSKKEENRKAQIWKHVFGETEWRAYCLARINYYLETERGKNLPEEDENLLSQMVQPEFWHQIIKESRREVGIKQESQIYGADSHETQKWKIGLAGLYLNCRLQTIRPDEEKKDEIFQLADTLLAIDDPVCVQNTKAVMGLFSDMLGNQENLGRWLLKSDGRKERHDVYERFPGNIYEMQTTYTEQIFQIRGYLMLRQYGKAGRLLQKTMPYLQQYHMTSLYAEALFQQAIVNWHMEQHGQALQKVIGSFLINGSRRYVAFYTIYGSIGVEVLEAYMEWIQNNIPGVWKRKKKYNYGNVLRMPVEDYMDVIVRKARHAAKKGKVQKAEEAGESLTMMETIVLQAICQGLSNAEISEQQNLKITTVKSHIYSMYKKLGVGSRMQAALKGKELGIV